LPTDSWLKWLERPHGTPVTRVRLREGADLRGLGKKIPSSDSLKAQWFRIISHGERSCVRVQGRRFGIFLICVRDLLYQALPGGRLTPRRSSLRWIADLGVNLTARDYYVLLELFICFVRSSLCLSCSLSEA